MPEQIVVIDVIVPPPPVIDVAALGVQGPPGADGEPGPAGPPGDQGPQGPAGVVPPDVVIGPASAGDNAIALFNGATGKAINADANGTISGSIAIGVNPSQSGALRLANNSEVSTRNSGNTGDFRLIGAYGNLAYVGSGATGVLLDAPYTWLSGGYLRLTEQSAPGAAPPANNAYLWLQDNGSGKTQLMVRFATGAAVQLAIEP